MKVKISSRGANLILVNLKNYTNYLKLPLNLIADNNHTINTIIKSRMGLTLETKNIFFKENQKPIDLFEIIFKGERDSQERCGVQMPGEDFFIHFSIPIYLVNSVQQHSLIAWKHTL